MNNTDLGKLLGNEKRIMMICRMANQNHITGKQANKLNSIPTNFNHSPVASCDDIHEDREVKGGRLQGGEL